ncbi:MAG TPA: MarR family transcriptional regulator [Solirubrobacteraceae bacterium]
MERARQIGIIEAAADALADQGASAAGVSVADICARAGVSAAVFHQGFADRDAVILAAFDEGVERARSRVQPAYESEPRWLDAIRAALVAFLGFVEEEPALARLVVIHSMGGGGRLLRRRAEILARVAAVVDAGRAETATGRQPPPAVIAEGVVGAVLAVLYNRLLAGTEKPIDLFGSLASIVVLPYLGASVARRELTRPVPRLRSEEPSPEEGRLAAREPEERLTYRTARVLAAIGGYPGASNREVAERAGVLDQGQISKLLGRLEERGLIEKIGGGRARGAPNSWRLTEAGEVLRRRSAALE